ncbi:MAG: GspH/FimT family pseudopilin [Wenzhouxiangellaceae bacterium]|nr:GspH/FimT family pseudopilin [Wenzhouxiangellaceae bacterium]
MKSTQSGLTLIELMIAVSIFAIITSLSMPSMRDFQQRARISAAANELVANINLARQRAVMDRENTMLCPSVDQASCSGSNRWDQGWIVFRDPDDNRKPDQPGDILRVGSKIEGLHVDSAGRNRIRYQPSGSAFGTNLTIKLCNPDKPEHARAVIVSNPGRPRVGDLPAHLSCPQSDS